MPSVDDIAKYGPAVWGWLTANPIVFMIAGGVLLVLGIYYAVRPPVPPVPAEKANTTGSPIVESVNIQIGYDNRGRSDILTFSATALKRGEKLDIFLDYATLGSNDVAPIQNLFQPVKMERRILITTIERFAPKQEIHAALGIVTMVDGQQQVLSLGSDGTGPKSGLSWGHFVGNVVLMANDGATQSFRFVILARAISGQMPPARPMVLGPNFLSSLNQW